MKRTSKSEIDVWHIVKDYEQNIDSMVIKEFGRIDVVAINAAKLK